jgi:hypothetical protein
MTACPLVLVEWEDSAQPIAQWMHLANVEIKNAILCVSVGWLIQDGPEVKVIAPNMGEVNNADNVQVSGVIRIPARCVRKITKLTEPSFSAGPSFRPERGRKRPRS